MILSSARKPEPSAVFLIGLNLLLLLNIVLARRLFGKPTPVLRHL
jgi:hypothetical protein